MKSDKINQGPDENSVRRRDFSDNHGKQKSHEAAMRATKIYDAAMDVQTNHNEN